MESSSNSHQDQELQETSLLLDNASQQMAPPPASSSAPLNEHLHETKLLSRIEAVAKLIGKTLHAGSPSFPKQDPSCKIALDFCTAILQQGGRRTSFGLGSPSLQDQNDITTVEAPALETMEVEQVLHKLSVTELVGACYILSYIYSRTAGRQNYKSFFLESNYDAMESASAASQLLGYDLLTGTYAPKTTRKVRLCAAAINHKDRTQASKTTTATANKEDAAKIDKSVAKIDESDENPQQDQDYERKPPSYATASASNPWRTIAYLQERILSVRHAHYCTYQTCPLMPSKCQFLKKLYKHLVDCRQGEACIIPQCLETKLILTHYRECSSPLCPLCSPVLVYLARTKTNVNTGSMMGQQYCQMTSPDLSHTAPAAAAAISTIAASVVEEKCDNGVSTTVVSDIATKSGDDGSKTTISRAIANSKKHSLTSVAIGTAASVVEEKCDNGVATKVGSDHTTERDDGSKTTNSRAIANNKKHSLTSVAIDTVASVVEEQCDNGVAAKVDSDNTSHSDDSGSTTNSTANTSNKKRSLTSALAIGTTASVVVEEKCVNGVATIFVSDNITSSSDSSTANSSAKTNKKRRSLTSVAETPEFHQMQTRMAAKGKCIMPSSFSKEQCFV